MPLPEFVHTVTDLYESYKKYISENPQFVADIETSIKWASYFIAGRMNSSAIISELIYSLSNLLVLFNDRIIDKPLNTYLMSDDAKPKLKLWLTVLEYCEVFIELSARKTWGENGRWFFILIVQVIKCIGRLLLTIHYKDAIVQSPAIRPLNRKNHEELLTNPNGVLGTNEHSTIVVLKRSKRVLRKVEGAPPIHLRDWKSLNGTNIRIAIGNVKESTQMTAAETLYIVKPLIHLGSLSVFGLNNWKSYLVALLIDTASLHIYYKRRKSLSELQKAELAKRSVSLLLYLLRSPFYERLSKDKINGLLTIIGQNIPLTHMVCNPLLTYIPHWQRTYFYMWST